MITMISIKMWLIIISCISISTIRCEATRRQIDSKKNIANMIIICKIISIISIISITSIISNISIISMIMVIFIMMVIRCGANSNSSRRERCLGSEKDII